MLINVSRILIIKYIFLIINITFKNYTYIYYNAIDLKTKLISEYHVKSILIKKRFEHSMCYAIPAKIIEIDGETAYVDYGGVKRKVNVSLMESIKTGDYILIHAGFAIEKLSKKSAEETLQLIHDVMQSIDENENDT